MTNPFQLLIDPAPVFQAVKDSPALNQLQSRTHSSGESPTPDGWEEFADKVLVPGRSAAKVERAREAHLQFLRAHPEPQTTDS
jgi:hypothetical protein